MEAALQNRNDIAPNNMMAGALLFMCFGLMGCSGHSPSVSVHHPVNMIQSPLPTNSTADADTTLQRAKALHFTGLEGDDVANRQAVTLLREWLKQHPDDAVALAYFGSARLLQAREKPAMNELFALSKEGLTALDQAVHLAPHNLEVRFMRAMACRHLPGFFGRSQQSIDDLTLIAADAEQAVQRGEFDARLATAALYHHGLNLEAAGRLQAAREAWQQAVNLPGAVDTPARRAAQQRLDETKATRKNRTNRPE